eukprot:jgi/Botrbrau1/14165/Bobra.182_3s0104.2
MVKGRSQQHLWLASSPGKRWTEVFFLAYSPFWMTWALGVLVPFQLYEGLGEWGYMAVGLCAGLPCFVLPLLLDPKADRQKPFLQKYWVKANLWIAIFSFIGNYFWTHYFYQLLGAQYTFPAHNLNGVPIALYFMTHAYFCFYHTLSNVLIRRTLRATETYGKHVQGLAAAALVFCLAYATAFMETLTIAHFPYYTFKDRARMYSVGSLFYAIYFFVSFPMYFIMDEQIQPKWTAGRAALDSLAAGMLVTILLDFWRLAIGSIAGDAPAQSLPWT